MNCVLYFPDSHDNILSATIFTELMMHDEETWVLKQTKYSIFTQDFGK